MYTASKLTTVVGQYRQIFAKDGMCTKEETIKMLEVDEDLAGLESKQIKQVADKILMPFTVETKSKRNLKQMNAERMKLYEQGLADCEIAEIQGVTTSSVHTWRRKRGLTANFSRAISEEEENRRMELYNRGFTDSQMAKEIGKSFQTAYEWRKKKGLSRNTKEEKLKLKLLERMKLLKLKDLKI